MGNLPTYELFPVDFIRKVQFVSYLSGPIAR